MINTFLIPEIVTSEEIKKKEWKLLLSTQRTPLTVH